MAGQDLGVLAYNDKGQRRPKFKNGSIEESPSANARAALDLAAKGFRVFPVTPLGKTPLTENGFRDATDKPAAVAVLWALHPQANIGVAMGEFVVLDIDGADGLGSFERITGHKDPLRLSPLAARTASGGYHVWFKRRGMYVRNRAGDIGPGLDVRGVTRDGEPAGYVLVAPSKAAKKDGSGVGSYEWLDPSALDRLDEVPEMARELAYLCTFNKHEREVIEGDTDLKAKIDAASPQDWIAVFDDHCPQQTTDAGEIAPVAYEHPYVQSIVKRQCDEIAAATWGCQEWTFNRACFVVGAQLKRFGLGPSADRAVTELVEAGKLMPNQPGKKPWTLRTLRQKTRRAVSDGLKNGKFAPKDLSRQCPKADSNFVPSDDRTAAKFGVSKEVLNADETAEFFNRMNREHALVSLTSSTRYLHKRRGPDGNVEFAFLRPDDMKRMYANVTVTVSGRPTNGFTAWDRWTGRLQFAGVGMFPGKARVPPSYLNTWSGPSIEPKEGDWSLFRDHLRNMVCGGNEELFTWLMDWLAHLFQHPDQKPESAVVIKSKRKATGKSMLPKFLRQILGAHVISVSKSEHLVGRFNAHMLRLLLLSVEEALWAGNKAAEGVLKDAITNEYLLVEMKGTDPIYIRNYTRLLFTSNEDWTVPADTDERRYFILEFDNPHANDPTYFNPIFKQMERQGGLGAMLYELLNRKITSNLRKPPETKALQQEREFSLDGVHKWLLETARSGSISMTAEAQKQYGWADPEVALEAGDKTEVPCKIVREAARTCCDRYEVKSLDTRLGRLLDKVGADRKQTMVNGKRLYVYVMPALPTLRWEAQKLLGIPIEGAQPPPPVIGRGRRQGARNPEDPE